MARRRPSRHADCPSSLLSPTRQSLRRVTAPPSNVSQRRHANLACFGPEIKARIRLQDFCFSQANGMLQSTFVLLKGIGEYTERRLWERGVEDWHTFLACPALPGMTADRKRLYDVDLAAAIHHLERGEARYFSTRLRPRDHWRLFATFKARAVYLDIETTGCPPSEGEVTVVGLYGDGRMTSLVRGDTLTEDRLNE